MRHGGPGHFNSSDFLDQYISPPSRINQTRKVRDKYWPELVETIASSFIRSAKDRRLTPDKLRLALEHQLLACHWPRWD